MKNVIKSALAIILTLFMIVSLISCGFVEIKDIDGDTVGDTKNVASGSSGDDGDTSTTEQENGGEEEEEEEEEPATVAEMVCFEYNGITVTAKEMIYDTFWGAGIKLHIENNSDKDYSIGAEQVIVNNCMITDYFSCTVAAGKKANETMYLSSSDLSAAGIDNIGQVEVYFYVYDSTTYDRIYETDCVTIKTSLYDEMDTTVENAGYTLYEKDGIKIVGKYVDEFTIWGKAVVLYIENNSNTNITVSCEDMSINGYMVTEFFSQTIYSGKYAISDITISSSSLTENDITEIEEFELKFRIYNADTYDTIVITDALQFRVS